VIVCGARVRGAQTLYSDTSNVSKVVVVGSTNTDMTVRVPRIPTPGETVLGGDFQITAGGKGANQAVAAARAGAAVLFVTALGTDDFGNRALENLIREGINVDLVRRVPGVASGVALIFVDEAGENSIAVAPGANTHLRPDDVAPLARILEADDVVLLQLEIPLGTVEAAVRVAVERHARLILNPAPAQALPDSLLAAVSLLTPNESEAEHLSGVKVDDGAWTRAAAALHERGVRDVLITLGARGVFVSAGDMSDLVPAFSVDAVDSTAAGDVFSGSLAAALVERQSPRDVILFASAAAAISVTRAGAQASAPSRAEIEAFLRDEGSRARRE
jgi:ribokinase